MPVSVSWPSGERRRGRRFYTGFHLCLLLNSTAVKLNFLHTAIELGMPFSVCASKCVYVYVGLKSLRSAGSLSFLLWNPVLLKELKLLSVVCHPNSLLKHLKFVHMQKSKMWQSRETPDILQTEMYLLLQEGYLGIQHSTILWQQDLSPGCRLSMYCLVLTRKM